MGFGLNLGIGLGRDKMKINQISKKISMSWFGSRSRYTSWSKSGYWYKNGFWSGFWSESMLIYVSKSICVSRSRSGSSSNSMSR